MRMGWWRLVTIKKRDKGTGVGGVKVAEEELLLL